VEAREAEVRSLVRADLEGFHAAAYGPRSAKIAVVGDVDAQEVFSLLATAFSGWSGGTAASESVPAAEAVPSPAEERIEIADRPNLDVYLGHRGALMRGDADFAAAMLANACLGQSTLTSRLGVAVRDDAGLSYTVSSRFFGTLGMAGPWSIHLGVAAENLDRAVAMCRQIITEFVVDGPSEDELADERTAHAGAYRVGLATNAGVARELVTTLTAGQPVDHLDRYPEQLLAATRDEVVEAIRRHIRPNELVLTAAGTSESS
jgi:zinc protease